MIGYRVVSHSRVVALVLAGDELAPLDIQGLYPHVLARVSWDEALLGEAFDIDQLIAARHGRQPAANEAPGIHREARAEIGVVTCCASPALAGQRGGCRRAYVGALEGLGPQGAGCC